MGRTRLRRSQFQTPSPVSCLGCRKWGFKRWRRISEEKGHFPAFSGFPRYSSDPPERGEKGSTRPISRKSGQTPLKPPFVTPPCAAARFSWPPQVLGGELSEFLSASYLCAKANPPSLPQNYFRNCLPPISLEGA